MSEKNVCMLKDCRPKISTYANEASNVWFTRKVQEKKCKNKTSVNKKYAKSLGWQNGYVFDFLDKCHLTSHSKTFPGNLISPSSTLENNITRKVQL